MKGIRRQALPVVQLLLHDDWEINGDGTGDPVELMIEPARRILDICDEYGAKYTFFAEVMQQFAMLDSSVPRHRRWAKEWEDVLKDAVARGHDVQLHLHPQWAGARFLNGQWRLDYNKWSIATLEEDEIEWWIVRGKVYLEQLLRPIEPDFQVLAFRAGGWMAQPSGALIRALRTAGVLADCSVVPGKHVCYRDLPAVDYRNVPSVVRPWFSSKDHLTEEGKPGDGVLVLPSYSEVFRGPLAAYLLLSQPFAFGYYMTIYRQWRRRIGGKEFTPATFKRKYRIMEQRTTYCSFGYVHYKTLLKMCKHAIRHAAGEGIREVPLVMLTHSKSFGSFKNFERLLRALKSKEEFQFARTRDLIVREMNKEKKDARDANVVF